MRAFVITGPNAGDVRDVPMPQPGAGEAVVKVEFVGICGTDYHIFQGDFPSTYPLVCGHEYSATIVALGQGTADWRQGDRITVDPSGYCG
jgi:threonine dehydrogenase-like Zn-dependent dehydrogenase